MRTQGFAVVAGAIDADQIDVAQRDGILDGAAAATPPGIGPFGARTASLAGSGSSPVSGWPAPRRRRPDRRARWPGQPLLRALHDIAKSCAGADRGLVPASPRQPSRRRTDRCRKDRRKCRIHIRADRRSAESAGALLLSGARPPPPQAPGLRPNGRARPVVPDRTGGWQARP